MVTLLCGGFKVHAVSFSNATGVIGWLGVLGICLFVWGLHTGKEKAANFGHYETQTRGNETHYLCLL